MQKYSTEWKCSCNGSTIGTVAEIGNIYYGVHIRVPSNSCAISIPSTNVLNAYIDVIFYPYGTNEEQEKKPEKRNNEIIILN